MEEPVLGGLHQESSVIGSSSSSRGQFLAKHRRSSLSRNRTCSIFWSSSSIFFSIRCLAFKSLRTSVLGFIQNENGPAFIFLSVLQLLASRKREEPGPNCPGAERYYLVRLFPPTTSSSTSSPFGSSVPFSVI